MEIKIDTEKDSKEHIMMIISMLQKIVDAPLFEQPAGPRDAAIAEDKQVKLQKIIPELPAKKSVVSADDLLAETDMQVTPEDGEELLLKITPRQSPKKAELAETNDGIPQKVKDAYELVDQLETY